MAAVQAQRLLPAPAPSTSNFFAMA
ncbi:rCG40483, isoform CRA_b [Rattus norvegicus]|uniref:RCG40483, isoform CRA_b n=1 Tax=Rattus norvegicus TaxID=10116 RepID=A6I8U7_RAT|nr:rCG40483, isoform CRA_b [Rattus norvegicus]